MKHFLFLLSCFSCYSQFPYSGATWSLLSASSNSDPAVNGGLKYWWVASDLPASTAVTAWTDRVTKTFVWTNGASSQRPTTSANPTNGIVFSGSQYLSNTMAPLAVNDTICIIMSPTNNTRNYDGIWVALNGGTGFNIGDGAGDASMYLLNTLVAKALQTNNVLDWMWDGSATPHFYTNNVDTSVAITTTGSDLRGLGGAPAFGFMKGAILEFLYWTNALTSLQRSNVHYYATNTYKFSP